MEKIIIKRIFNNMINLNRPIFKYKLSISLIFVVLICLYIKVPLVYSYSFCLIAFILSIIAFFIYCIWKKNNYFDFDIIFSIAFIFVYFIYPVFVFPINKTRFFMFNYGFNEKVITKSTLLASIGFIAFLLGLMNEKKTKIEKTFFKYHSLTISTLLIYLFDLLHFFQVYILRQGLVYGKNGNADPAASGGIWGYVSIIRSSIIMASMTIAFYNYLKCPKESIKIHKLNYLFFWNSILIEIIITLSTGSRGGPLGYILVIISGIAILKGGISLRKLLLLVLIGMAGLSFIVVRRSGGAFKFSLNIIDMAMDLIINNYTLFIAYDYVNNKGNEIFTLIGSLLSAIPFLAGLVVRTFNINPYKVSSARFFSILALGDKPKFGVGTNIIASIYLALGLIGVIVLMFLFGKFILKINIQSKNENFSIIKLLLYFEMMSVAVYMSRADYFFQVGKIVFGIFFLFIFITIDYIWDCKNKMENVL